MKRFAIIVLVIIGIAALGAGGWMLFQQVIKPASINSYADCVAAGYPILESYPEQCNTPDGKHFTNPDAIPQGPPGEFTSLKGTPITLENWSANPDVSSPLKIQGSVPGNWSFEASFPVQLTDSDGTVLAQAVAQLEGDWMTEEMVPFKVTLAYERPEGTNRQGFLVLNKDNPSGLPENDDSVTIPVTFK
jgi:hypothetical protein